MLFIIETNRNKPDQETEKIYSLNDPKAETYMMGGQFLAKLNAVMAVATTAVATRHSTTCQNSFKYKFTPL